MPPLADLCPLLGAVGITCDDAVCDIIKHNRNNDLPSGLYKVPGTLYMLYARSILTTTTVVSTCTLI